MKPSVSIKPQDRRVPVELTLSVRPDILARLQQTAEANIGTDNQPSDVDYVVDQILDQVLPPLKQKEKVPSASGPQAISHGRSKKSQIPNEEKVA